MLNKVNETIKKYNMLKKSERVLVGLSGGADSVSLLLCLKELGYSITACHINHQLRGEESLRDEQFCIDLCNSISVPIIVKRIEVKEYAAQHKISLEESGRILRYETFKSLCFDKIATAHNLNDCLETTVFNLARGSGLKGICSIPPIRDNIVRPLIECSRQDIEKFLKEKSQSFVTDSTNLQNEYSRNKIRNIVIPLLKEINPNLNETYKKTLANLKTDEDYLDNQAEDLLKISKIDQGYSISELMNAHPAVRNRALAKIIKSRNISYSYDKINSIYDILKTKGKINLSGNYFAVSENGIFDIKKIEANKQDTKICIAITDFSKTYRFFEKSVSFEILDFNGIFANVHKKFANACLDYDKIKGNVYLRNRNFGDRIQLCGRNFTSSVKKLFNAEIPLEQREKTAMLQDDNGLIYIDNFGCSDNVKVDKNTKHLLIVKIS
ncbi:MAG: tRNA lysidine(34) synthetase TilS [Oscillospiraceae bacterium]